MSEQLFYLVSRHGGVGTNVMFHNLNGAGYGTNLNDLHVFTLEEAQKQLVHNIRSLPLLKSQVDALAIKAVDHQYLDESKCGLDIKDNYVIQITGCWNGNDIAFAVMGGKTYDYSKAAIFSIADAKAVSRANTIIWPKSYLDSICRSTFQEDNINIRKMVTGAGIKYKKPRKPRMTSGKSRGNCPVCGQITWDFNPYENAYCNSHDKEWKRPFGFVSGVY